MVPATATATVQDPLKEMKLPDDEVMNHLIFEVHSYPDIKNLSSAKSTLNTTISNLKKNLASKGAPIIFGEWGTSTDKAYEQYRSNMLSFYRYFIEQTKKAGIGTFHWMGLSDGDHRSVPEFNQADLVEAIIKGYYGEDGYISGIENLTPSPSATGEGRVADEESVYDLSGRRVCSFTPNLDNLPKGVYVVGGRKIVVR